MYLDNMLRNIFDFFPFIMFSLSFYGRKEDVAKIKKNILDIKLKLAEM